MISKKRQEPGPVLRVRIERKEGKWNIVKRIRLPEKTIPSSDDLLRPDRTGRFTGFWFEAVDAKGNLLYRQMLRKPQRGVELFEDDGTISRVSVETDEYSVDLLLPDLPEVEDVHLFLEEPDRMPERELAKRTEAPQPIAVFPARENDSSEQDQKEGR